MWQGEVSHNPNDVCVATIKFDADNASSTSAKKARR